MTKKSETAQKPWDEDPKNLYTVRRIPGRKRWAYATEEERTTKNENRKLKSN